MNEAEMELSCQKTARANKGRTRVIVFYGMADLSGCFIVAVPTEHNYTTICRKNVASTATIKLSNTMWPPMWRFPLRYIEGKSRGVPSHKKARAP